MESWLNDVETTWTTLIDIVQTHMLKTMERKGFKADEKGKSFFKYAW